MDVEDEENAPDNAQAALYARKTFLLLKRVLGKMQRNGVFKKKKRVPQRATDELHIRILFERDGQFYAAVLSDRFTASSWTFTYRKPSRVSLRVAKTDVLEDLAVDFTKVFRVSAAHGLGRGRRLAGLFKTRMNANGSLARTVRAKPLYDVTLLTAVEAGVCKNDLADVCALAGVPRDAEEALTAWSARCGVPLPLDTAAVREACLGTGMSREEADFLVAAMRHDGALRVAHDVRFSALLLAGRACAPLASFLSSCRRRAALKMPTELLAPVKKDFAVDAFTLPFYLLPRAVERPVTTCVFRRVLTGVARPLPDRNPGRAHNPSVVVNNRVVVAYVTDGVLTSGGESLVPPEQLEVMHETVTKSLRWTDSFANRLDTVAFDGEKEWCDADLRSALALARRATWAFQDPEGEKAKALYERIKMM